MRPHGTDSRYSNDDCRCDECRQAHTDAARERRWRRKAGPAVPHGKTRYRNYGCRCKVCRDAVAADARNFRSVRFVRPELVPHGTVAGKRDYYCKCDACVNAWRAAFDPASVPHGTATGYQYHGCRCAACRQANAEKARARRKRASEQERRGGV